MVKLLATLLDILVFSAMVRRVKPSLRAPNRERLKAYLNPALLAHPESFYTKPEAVPAITDSLTLVKQRARYDVYDFHFPSAITSPWPENNVVYGRYFKTKLTAAAPTVIVLHGWLAFSYLWFSTICRKLAEAGISSLLPQLPYHMRRQPPESRFSGEYAINGDLAQGMEMIRQSVADTRSLVNWLKSNHPSPVGLWGVSLGGWISALAAAMEPRLDFAVLMMPAVRPDDVMWHSKLCPPLKEVVASTGITYEQVQAVTKIVTPKYFQPRLPPENILLMEAEFDQAVRPQTIEEIWKVWDRPRLKSYPHGHISIILSRRALNDGVNFIRSVSGGDAP